MKMREVFLFTKLSFVTTFIIFTFLINFISEAFGSIQDNLSLMMPGRNMTFGSSLDNAKMHLMEAIMDLEEGNINGALIQLNLTEDGIKIHEKQMRDMMNMIMMAQLWVNLPRAHKMSPPRYQALTADQMGRVTLDDGGYVRVIAGEHAG